MFKWIIVVTVLLVSLEVGVKAQVPDKIDFQRDVQPIFKAQCIGCHGPSQQKNSFRLDRRRDAMRGGTTIVIGPGNSAGSRLYLRLIGSDFGMQMPPTGPLNDGQIAIIKRWIDQGAEWPDAAAGEKTPTRPNPLTTQIMEPLRLGNHRAFIRNVGRYPRAINLRGTGGATPLMYAALYGNADDVRLLLSRRADPNLKNDSGATALMWAVDSSEKTSLLVAAGADVNARSDDGQTPLLIAASYYGSKDVVKLLLDRGADPSIKVTNSTGEMTPLAEAAYAGDADVIQLLLDRGADPKKGGGFALSYAAFSLCSRCVDLLMKRVEPADVSFALIFNLPPSNGPRAARLLLERGADINATDPEGRNVLMLIAAAETAPVDLVTSFISQGVDCKVKSPKGYTAFDFARRHGSTPMVDLLANSGAKEGTPPPPPADRSFAPADSVKTAIDRSLPLLQRTDVSFLQKSGCVSCHNNTFTAMTVAAARENGFRVNETIARQQLKAVGAYIDNWSERMRQSVGLTGDSDTTSYIMLGLAAENYPRSATTDAMARFLLNKQSTDGRWLIFAHRPPIESTDISVTAASLRALQVYLPQARRGDYERSIERATRWLATTEPQSNEDLVFQSLGLSWANRSVHPSKTNHTTSPELWSVTNERLLKTLQALINNQRADGGWAQLKSLGSDAYATGQAMVAMHEAVAVLATNPKARPLLTAFGAAEKRGTKFLLSTQLADGSWYVRSRALPIQPFFDSNFPHGHDQFISAAATNWATMALALSGRD